MKGVCEVRTKGGKWDRWQKVAIRQSVGDESWILPFSLQAPTSQNTPDFPFPLDRVDIALDGNLLVKEGYIRDAQPGFNGTARGVQLDGYSKAGPITKISAEAAGGGQFRDYKIDALANAVLKKSGIKFSVENGPKGWDTPFPNVSIRHGETAFQFIKRLCGQRGLFFWAEPSGDIVAGSRSGGGSGELHERQCLIGRAHISAPEADAYVMRSQQPGSDSLFGKRASEVSAKGTIEGGMPGRRIVINEMPANEKELQVRANAEAQVLQSSYLRVHVTVDGWTKPDGSGLWQISEPLKLTSPILFPRTKTVDLRVWSVAYTQDENDPDRTSLELVNERSFNVMKGDATKADEFNRVKPAESEQPA